jgi:hypothetical protein
MPRSFSDDLSLAESPTKAHARHRNVVTGQMTCSPKLVSTGASV